LAITISGRHFHVTEPIKNYAEQKAEKLRKYYDRITKVAVTMDTEGNVCKVEIIVSAARGITLVAEARHDDMYAAVDLAFAKVERQVTKEKERVRSRRP